ALAGLLALIKASDGRIESRIRIQKVAFLLAARGSRFFEPADFVFYYYGPYSRSLSDMLHQAVSFGLINETREEFSDENIRYSYQLTETGRKLLESSFSEPDEDIRALVPKLDSCHWRALELAATVAFLERSGDAENRKHAFAEALRLKCACASYVKDAEHVLSIPISLAQAGAL
ncbi:MAG: hypothetical protein L0Z53_19300, partial [Acidobacteriales bacterium]|nr:hypothetical protein [Terriglobales bacterium]